MPKSRARLGLLAVASLFVALAASCDDRPDSLRDGTNAGLAGADADARHLSAAP
jgi:hypothetical protein